VIGIAYDVNENHKYSAKYNHLARAKERVNA